METTVNTASALTINDVQKLKNNLVHYIGLDRWHNNSQMMFKDDYLWLVSIVADDATGFAKDVAATVLKYEKCSEKQAYVIARAACELGINFEL